MTTEGIEAVFLETHNWGKAVKFWQELGFEPEFSTDHASGQLRNENGPYHTLADWVRPRNLYGQGGIVEPNARYHQSGCPCSVHQSAAA